MTAPHHTRRPGKGPFVLVAGVLAVVVLAAGLVTVVVRRSGGTSTPKAARSRPSFTLPSTSTATTVPTAQPPAAPGEPAYVTEIKQQVSELRGLAWKAPLVVEVVPRDELTRRAQAANDRDRRPDRQAGDEDTLKILHLIPADLNLTKTLDELLTGVILGFYDPETMELVVRDAGGADGEVDGTTKVALAHELDHALTDQWFDLGPETDALDEADREEEIAGYVSLIEGDAKFLEARFAEKYLTEEEQLSYALGGLGGEGAESLPKKLPPEFLVKSLYFPYEAGLAFVEAQAGNRPDPFAGIDAAWQRPPTSTEQILHPDTYAAGQQAVTPDLVDVAAATGCESRRRNTLGEFTMRELLDSELDTSTAEAAARGWNGDVYQTVRCGTSLGMVERWQSDADVDADRLAAALYDWAARWSESGPGGTARIVRSGSVVTLVLGADAATADRLAAATTG